MLPQVLYNRDLSWYLIRDIWPPGNGCHRPALAMEERSHAIDGCFAPLAAWATRLNAGTAPLQDLQYV